MSIYETPLQFGYFLALLFALLFWYRGWQEERLSDKILGFVVFFLAMEIQDYTFGFAGINILWEKFDGFPRYFTLAFAPTIYFYLKSQINRDFKFETKHLWHYIPYLIYFLVYIGLFLSGKVFLNNFRKMPLAHWLGWLEKIAGWASYIYYFYQSLKIYHNYRKWTETQFSDTDTISLVWLRNFIYLIIAGEIFKFSWSIIDSIFDLTFEEDWWWHLLTVVIIAYVSIKGYTNDQAKKIVFTGQTVDFKQNETQSEPIQSAFNQTENNFSDWKPRIEKIMKEDRIFLESELSLTDMAQKLKTNSSVLSAAINQNFNKNFNDFINEFRIEEFKKQVELPSNKHFTKLGIALDCGFNSKATFNRALKKFG